MEINHPRQIAIEIARIILREESSILEAIAKLRKSIADKLPYVIAPDTKIQLMQKKYEEKREEHCIMKYVSAEK
jgi:hypothetical protein